jgi:hypothetical protein
MLRHLAAEAASSTPADVTAAILQWGPGGVVILLLLSGVLVTKGHLQEVKAERDQWRAAYQQEEQGHNETRSALAESSRAASAAVETARTTAGLLSNLGHIGRPGN